MKNSDKLEQIRDILKDEYTDKMSDDTVAAFAEELYDSMFVEQYDLDDIFAIVGQYEDEAELEDSELLTVFGRLIDLLDNCETTAKRLYKSFMYDADILDTFVKLINENEEYIGAEKLAKAKEKAFGVFDRQLLEMYGITE